MDYILFSVKHCVKSDSFCVKLDLHSVFIFDYTLMLNSKRIKSFRDITGLLQFVHANYGQ